jgi:ribonuclease HI
MPEEHVVIYTDGACDPNPGPGGWAAILRSGPHEKVISGSHPDTTNNRMELQAALSALRALKRPCHVTLHTDSEYVRQGITEWLPAWRRQGWRTGGRRPVQNQDLWQALATAAEEHRVEWRWVRGHAGDPLNERADRLARAAIPGRSPSVMSEPEQVENSVLLYTRASCLGSSGPGGWAVVRRRGDEISSQSGSVAEATANEMELLAAIKGLESLQEQEQVHVYTVSQYLHQGITRWVDGWQARGWQTKQGQPVRHKRLWLTLLETIRDHQVEWILLPKNDRPAESEQAATLAAQAAHTEQDRLQAGRIEVATDSPRETPA